MHTPTIGVMYFSIIEEDSIEKGLNFKHQGICQRHWTT